LWYGQVDEPSEYLKVSNTTVQNAHRPASAHRSQTSQIEQFHAINTGIR
jgi:hypothetical protein